MNKNVCIRGRRKEEQTKGLRTEGNTDERKWQSSMKDFLNEKR